MGTSSWANGNTPPRPDEFSPELIDNGKPLYNHYCAHCHGLQGDGDGYNADHLEKEPAELSSYKFISKKTNEQLFKVITLGGKGVRKSHLMPVFGRTLAEEEVWSLVAYIRFLAKDTTPVTVPHKSSKIRPQLKRVTPEMIHTFSQWFSENGNQKEIVERGQILFHKKKSCLACHRIGEEDEDGEELGGVVGPDLARAGYLYAPEWLYTWIRNPQFIKPNSKMPTIGLDDEEGRAVTAYLASLQGEGLPDELAAYLEGTGNPEKGRELFFDSEGNAFCTKCHTVRGKGGTVGPELSYVGSTRSREFLLESILKPNAVITVGYKAILILTKKGKFLTGIKVNEDEGSLDIIDKEGNPLHISKDDIKKFKTQKISIMPGNFKDILNVEDVKNILAFLSSLKVQELSENQVSETSAGN